MRAGSESPASPPKRVAAGIDIRRLARGSDGMWAAVGHQVLAIEGGLLHTVPLASPLAIVNDIVEDAAGDLWIATSRGLVVVRRQGIALFSSRHGLTELNLQGLRRDSAGRVFAVDDGYRIYRIAGDALVTRRLALPGDVIESSWPTTSFLMDRTGEIWLGTGNGLLRFGRVDFSAPNQASAVLPKQRYTRRDGLAGDHISEIFEDSRGDLWIASTRDQTETLTIWRRASSRFERVGAAHGVPPFSQPMGLVEDTAAVIWSGLREGGVLRIEGGRAAVYGVEHGFPSLVTATLVDRSGNLWLGGSDSVVRIDRMSRDVRATPMMSGLTGRVLSLEEDPAGHIAVGTMAGLVVLDPVSRKYRRLTRSDGVPDGPVDALARAADGAIVMIAGRALARWTPTAATIAAPDVRCLLTGVRAAGRQVPVQSPGVEQLAHIEVPAAQNAIEFEFFAVSRRLGERLTYQYRLVGLSDEWITASQRRAAYQGLAAGDYTFEVRAAGAGAAIPSAPARVAFSVLPPWYRRGWFLATCGATVLLLGYAAHRTRLAAALRTERLRSRIATDLHDDIGSSLSQIAILAEVAKRRAGDRSSAVAEPLTSIAATSRDLVEAMSDIVWAVNPQTDSLSDLTHRMRRFAEETLGAADIALTFSAPPDEADLRMGADVRRELYLIVKESVNNIARHSGATAATIDFRVTRRELRLRIADNGRGFTPDGPLDGHGITSMRKRAAALGGRLQIESRNGEGTVVSLSAKR